LSLSLSLSLSSPSSSLLPSSSPWQGPPPLGRCGRRCPRGRNDRRRRWPTTARDDVDGDPSPRATIGPISSFSHSLSPSSSLTTMAVAVETIDSSLDLCTIFFRSKTVKKLGKVTVLQRKTSLSHQLQPIVKKLCKSQLCS